MPWSVLGAIFFLLMGFGVAWLGISMVHPSRSPVYDRDGRLQRYTSPTETRLRLIAWTTTGRGLVGFGLTTLRHTRGRFIDVSASAPPHWPRHLGTCSGLRGWWFHRALCVDGGVSNC